MIMIQGHINSHPESEFTKLVSRGKLDFPTEELFNLLLYLYSHFKSVEDKSWTTCPVKCFNKIYMFLSNKISNHVSVLQRFVNCFGKASAAKESESLIKKEQNIKKYRMSNKTWNNVMFYSAMCYHGTSICLKVHSNKFKNCKKYKYHRNCAFILFMVLQLFTSEYWCFGTNVSTKNVAIFKPISTWPLF